MMSSIIRTEVQMAGTRFVLLISIPEEPDTFS